MNDVERLHERSARSGDPHRYAIVLAGGEGTRLAAVAQEAYGYARPKQFCQFGSEQSLLEETLERAERFTCRPSRIAVAVTRRHRTETDECLADWPEVVRVEQPGSLDTGPAILYALLHVLARDPLATVLVLPSDHHLSDDRAFVDALIDASHVLEDDPDRVLLAGARLQAPEPGLGWIVPAPTRGAWSPILRFVEKPDEVEAQALFDAGALANTFVILARGAALARLFGLHTPDWWMELSGAFVNPEAVEQLYLRKGPSNFSHDVLAHAVASLGVIPLDGVEWSDIGTPERLFARRGTPTAQGRSKRPAVA